MAAPSNHYSAEALKGLGLLPPQIGLSRQPRLRPYVGHLSGLVYPLPNYAMWRGNHNRYQYNRATPSTWGEGETGKLYHQHYAHAKCPTDYGRAGREFEFLTVKRGKLQMKPLPKVQYVHPDSKPKWLFKSWHNPLSSATMWEREVQYPEHTPDHLGAKRPLAVIAPKTFHKHLFLMHMEKINITVSPFVFGFGNNLQKAALDFYRRALSARSPFPNDKIFLYYSIDQITPKIEVIWLDGNTYVPPVIEGVNAQDLIQMVMEQAWLAADRMSAEGRALNPIAIDDYKWEQVIAYKAKRVKDAKGGAKKK
ncbi:hypothetical protein AGDE_06048 [Angomonas deanei]|uniref:Uncharacterized protein n=1 Tax=Angomonas deanei TaxID=59799 RepID=S9WPF1_9TRYP|nr:hypothetical protein AGDE_07829 [Angomonas deanei]EPY37885.1 hypothetical protein AGDE_06048 [Angomonas deanei]CAD2222982.1 hypothetical protein, conserved [Angomonas deanei]|eukprot:EPY34807.1 hypothetical protein AGDE_07829 [Angomonas deanei]